MTDSRVYKVTAITDPETGDVEASAVFDTTSERLFHALTTKEICNWWVRPGVFNTQEWTGDIREGGRWGAAGVGGGQPYQLEGEFLTIDKPRKLTLSWKPVGAPVEPATLICDLEPQVSGVCLTLRHTGLPNAEICEKTRAGWETSLVRLQEIIAAEKS
ncbi:SRPBCC family protein [Rhodophyticola sp. CCM32]|uniref:SRPBCC family protein n=1 Tax=Rhodophyticola sp. CCM32 TaxID=2916397 RepID=UPI00143CE173|nr:SRPBCC domain-containing protein [Rhodophyticola sp. CCM32]